MTIPPQGGPPPGEPGRSQPQQPWSQQPWSQQPWPQRQPGSPPWPQQTGPWGAPAPGPHGGQPSSGQPPDRAWNRTLLGLVALAVLLVLAVVLARLLGDTVLDSGAVERDVAEQFEERYGVGVDLDCPAEMTVEPEAVYRCTGTTGDGEEVTLEIRITEVIRAAYTWDEV